MQQGQALVMEREALNKKLLLLDEKYQKDRQDIEQKYSRKELENAVKSKSDEYRTRILQAQIDAGAGQEGEIAAAKEMLSILKEQLDYIELNADAFRDSGKSEADILAMRLDLLNQIEKANEDINRKTQKAISDETALAYRTASTAARAAGSLSTMFDALGGRGRAIRRVCKSVGGYAGCDYGGYRYCGRPYRVAQSIPSPINVLTVAASVAAITAAIASAVNSVKSTEVPEIRLGGLISGPGTGTSDSIPALLSNGEAAATANAVNEWGAMLSAMNVSSGGNAINVSNLPPARRRNARDAGDA